MAEPKTVSMTFPISGQLDDETALAFVKGDLLSRKFSVQNEAELNAAVYAVVRERRHAYGMIGREVPLSPTDRIDFLIPTIRRLKVVSHETNTEENQRADLEQLRAPKAGGLGIELKVDGSTVDVGRQLQRYAQSERITTLVLVTTLRRHRTLDGQSFNGKKVHVVRVAGGFL